MTTSYRMDYHTPGEDNPDAITVVLFRDLDSRRDVMDKARRRSAVQSIGTVYLIATRDGVDVGQRVYVNGRFSYSEGAF